jgi:hypothetical protein
MFCLETSYRAYKEQIACMLSELTQFYCTLEKNWWEILITGNPVIKGPAVARSSSLPGSKLSEYDSFWEHPRPCEFQ